MDLHFDDNGNIIDMDMSVISDQVTITVAFKNGDKAKSVVDIGFSKEGKMNVKYNSYEYIRA